MRPLTPAAQAALLRLAEITGRRMEREKTKQEKEGILQC